MSPTSIFSRAVSHLALGLPLLAAATLARAADGIEWIAISPPVSAMAGATIQFSATVRNSGTTSWNNDCYLELKDAVGTHLNYPSIAGVAPGGTITCTFTLTLPTNPGDKSYYFTGVRHNVAYFGATQSRVITVNPAPVYQGVTLPSSHFDAASGSYLFTPGNLPTINTTDAMTPYYRLRAKIAHPDTNGWGWHAANIWQNNGLQIDNPPTIPGTYQLCSLYWLKYSSEWGTLLEMGPEHFVKVTVPGGVLALEYYSFGNLTPPKIYTTAPQELGGTYWLFAKFKGGGQNWDAAPRPANAGWGSNNNHQSLSAGALPPPGQYDLELTWKRYDENGNVFATGPVFSVNNAVIYAGAGPVLSVSGSVDSDGGYDENGNWGHEIHPAWHDFSSPIDGTINVEISALFNVATQLFRVVNGEEQLLAEGGANFTAPAVASGSYRLRIDSADGSTGSYSVTVGILSSQTAPSYTSTSDAVSGEFGKPLAYNAYAGGSGTVTYTMTDAPPGVGISGNGIVSGTPTAAGSFTATIRAQNSLSYAIKTVEFYIAKAKPKMQFDGLTVENQPLLVITQDMLTGVSAASSVKLDRPVDAPASVPLPTGAVTFSAVRAWDTSTSYNPFTPVNALPGLTIFYGPLLVTARYPGDANYLAWSPTATFQNKDTIPPAAPANLRQALVGSTSFSVNWDDVIDQPTGIRAAYEVQLDSGPIIYTAAPTRSFAGLAAGSTHTVKVRAKEAVGLSPQPLVSDWASLNVPLPATAPDPSSAPRWVDINGDGIRDEVIGGNTNQFNYAVAETSSTTVTYTEYISTFEPFIFPFYNSYTELYSWVIGGWWNDDEITTTETISTVRPEFQVMTEPGYDFVIGRAVVNENATGPVQDRTVFRRVHTIPGTERRLETWMPDGFWPEEAFFAFPTVVARLSKPSVGATINLPIIGPVSVRSGPGGVTGTMTLPSGISISASGNGASISAPGIGTVAINNGVIAASVNLPGGYSIGATSNGALGISGPGGVSLSVSNGGVALGLPGGNVVTMNSAGKISIRVTPGTALSVLGALDELGKAMGIDVLGPGVRAILLPAGASPTPGGWGSPANINLGGVIPGIYRIGITNSQSANPAENQIYWADFVSLPEIKIAVDANRDGTIAFDASDATSAAAPYRFWINDDDDGDQLRGEYEFENTSLGYEFNRNFGIRSRRDLEDFTRLWLNCAGISDALKSGDLQIGLQWRPNSTAEPNALTGAPAINLFRHFESDGGRRYLTDDAAGSQQIAPAFSTVLVDAGNKNVVSSTNGVFIFKKEVFANLSNSQTKTFLLFEGAGVGKGQLQVLLLDKNGNQIGEGSGVWLDVRRINTMFERVKVTTQNAPSSNGIDTTMLLPHDYMDPAQVPQPTMGWTADDRGDAFVPDPGEDLQNKNYIVFVHGWRQAPGQGSVGVSSSLTFARTMYKRLWHAGYKGRFAALRWPTFYGGSDAGDDDPLRGYTTYNDSEYRAWKSGQSLAQYVNQLPSGYKRRIAAHSMGNIVAGSAFKYGMAADSYAMLNAAVPAICYEETALRRWPIFSGIYSWLTFTVPSQSPNAPNSNTPVDDTDSSIRSRSYVRQLDAISATVVNFYLESDFATSISWNANNVIMRPHTASSSIIPGPRQYVYSRFSAPAVRLALLQRTFFGDEFGRSVIDPHEGMAYDCLVPTFTVNATGGTRGSIAKPIDMGAYGFDREHSAQWQWRFQQTAPFYHDLLVEFGLTPTL